MASTTINTGHPDDFAIMADDASGNDTTGVETFGVETTVTETMDNPLSVSLVGPPIGSSDGSTNDTLDNPMNGITNTTMEVTAHNSTMLSRTASITTLLDELEEQILYEVAMMAAMVDEGGVSEDTTVNEIPVEAITIHQAVDENVPPVEIAITGFVGSGPVSSPPFSAGNRTLAPSRPVSRPRRRHALQGIRIFEDDTATPPVGANAVPLPVAALRPLDGAALASRL